MPHNKNINQDHTFVLYGTEIPYTGRVLQIGDKYFTTQGGGIEGDREEVTIVLPTEGNIGNQLSTINSEPLSGTGNASGNNPEASLLLGVPVVKVQFYMYVLSGLSGALAGVLLTAMLGAAAPNAAGSHLLTIIAAIILGGTSLYGGIGSVWGTLFAVLILGTINNGLTLMN